MDWQTVAALLSIAIAALTWVTSASKGKVENLVAIINAQSGRMSELERDLDRTEARNAILVEGVQLLVRQLVDHDLVPCWTPPPAIFRDEG